MSVATVARRIYAREQSARGLGANVGYLRRVPNAETLAAMQEVEDIISGKIPNHPQSVESLFEELGINVRR